MSWMLRRAATASAPTLARFSEMTKMRGYSSCPAWMAWGWPCMDKSRMAVIEPCKSSTRCVRMLHAIGCGWPNGGMSGDRHLWGRHVEGGRGVRGRRHREDGKLTGEDGREAMRGWPRMAKGGCSRDCEKAATKDGLDGYGNHGR